ncbi:MAG: cysteine synthase A [Anaerolineae bacterium]|nr:cysteine synthase A [Anaerolineae bacterium]MDK1117991.1 cysteine synthase A [Anaerolineae bacterium]
MIFHQDFTEMIGNTPLLLLGRWAANAEIYAKCEFMNPLSLKDRPILQIITDAEEGGQLKPGGTLLEATSGNTGMAVASIAAVKGYQAVLVMSEIQSLERRQVLKALGAELILTPASEGTIGAKKKLDQVLEENPDYFYVGQHSNPSNPKAHYQTTGPEIWLDTDGTVDILVAGLGTGGTICGAGRFLKEKKADVQLIAVEPKESPFISQGVFHPHRMMGTAPGFVPEILEREIIDEIYLVSEAEAFETVRQLARSEGILVGISSGAAAFAAAEIAKRQENKAKKIVCIFADTGQRYLSVEGLFD